MIALVLYPTWSALAGHPYPQTPTFGLPCPTTIFTIGVLCFAVPPTPRSPLIVPMLRCLVGAQAALAHSLEGEYAPWFADPVFVRGRVRTGDVVGSRAGSASIVRRL